LQIPVGPLKLEEEKTAAPNLGEKNDPTVLPGRKVTVFGKKKFPSVREKKREGTASS